MLKKIICTVLVLFLVLPFYSCAKRDTYAQHSFFAMNTSIEIYVSTKKDATELFLECERLVREIEGQVSKTVRDSDIYVLNQNGYVTCRDHTLAVFIAAEEIYEITDGAFDPTLGAVTELWNSLDGKDTPPSEETLSALIEKSGFDKVKRDGSNVTAPEGMTLDFGGIAKGYAATKVAEYIENNADKYKISGGMLSFGGAVSVFGEKADGTPYSVGIRDPKNKDSAIGYLKTESGHVSVSGDYERYVTVGGEHYHHILSPETGYPAESGLSSVAVLSCKGEYSDGLSTALFVMGYEKAMSLYQSDIADFEAVFVFTDGTVKTTPKVEEFFK